LHEIISTMPATAPISESEILAEVLAADSGDLPPDVAQTVLRWKFSNRTAKRISQLAQRNQRGTITAAERETLERYLRVGSLLNLVQAKARLSLKMATKNGK
jgi:hypothetical protein